MIRTLIMGLCLLLPLSLWAQYPSQYRDIGKYQSLDSALYLVTYKVKLTLDPKKGKTSEDLMMLQLGKHASATYSIPLFEVAQKVQKLLAKGAEAVPMHQEITFPEDVYKLRSSSRLQALYRTYVLGPHYLYEEPLPTIDWQIMDEYKEILGYRVQQAKCSYRGRKYVAWFTSEIPLSDGPWKFCGLPGLILEVADEQGEFHFLSLGIERAPKGTDVRQFKWLQQKVSRSKLRQAIKQMHAHPSRFLREMAGCFLHTSDGSDPEKLSHPYNPIELE